MNNVCLMGRIGQDLEIKTVSSGKIVLSFSIGVKNLSKDQNSNTDWIDCVAWEKTAEFIHRYFRKGSLIAITGRLSTRVWEDKNGNKRKSTEVIVTNADFTGEKNDGSNNAGSYQQRGNGMAVEVSPPADDFLEMADDSELPF